MENSTQERFSSAELDRVEERLNAVRSNTDLRIEAIGLDRKNYEKLRQKGVKTVDDLIKVINNLRTA